MGVKLFLKLKEKSKFILNIYTKMFNFKGSISKIGCCMLMYTTIFVWGP